MHGHVKPDHFKSILDVKVSLVTPIRSNRITEAFFISESWIKIKYKFEYPLETKGTRTRKTILYTQHIHITYTSETSMPNIV